MRLCLELLPKKEINGQSPVVTPPTKQALSNFESQSKTRPSPTNNSNSRPQHPSHPNNNVHSGPMQNYGGRMPMNQPMRPMPPGMQGGPRMQGPPGFNAPPNMNQQPPRFQGSPQWNGPRPSGPGPNMAMRPGGPPPGPQGPPRPPMVREMSQLHIINIRIIFFYCIARRFFKVITEICLYLFIFFLILTVEPLVN